MITLPRVASRIFGAPLAIDRAKLEIILAAIGPRLQGMPMDDPEDMDLLGRTPYDVTPEGIACIEVSGTLVAKSSGMDAMSGLTSYADLSKDVTAALQDPQVRGIEFSFDSPGGEVAGMFDLAKLISGARGQKPMCAVVECAASAAYLLASCCDAVVVSQTGLTGSVGIIALHRDVSGADEKAGLKYTAIYAGDRKNDGNPHQPLSPEARTGIQGQVDTIYGMFTGDVARYRGMTDPAVRATQAAIYMGADGVKAGFADAVASPDVARAVLVRAIQRGERSLTASSFTSSAASAARKEPLSMAEQQEAAERKVPTPAEIDAMVSQATASATETERANTNLIVSMCALQGKPELIAGFLAAKKTPADAGAELMRLKVEADEKLKLNPGLLPGGAEKQGDVQGKAEPWSKVFKAIGIRTKVEGK